MMTDDAQEQKEERLLRAAEAAAILGVTRSKVYEMIAANQIPSVHIGKLVRVPASRLQQWIRLKIAKECPIIE